MVAILLNPRHLYLVKFFEESGIRVLNSFSALNISSNKLLSTLIMKRAGLEVPKTVLTSKGEIDSLENYNFPVLSKSIYGRGSSGIEIFFNRNRLKEADGNEIYLQEYFIFAYIDEWHTP